MPYWTYFEIAYSNFTSSLLLRIPTVEVQHPCRDRYFRDQVVVVDGGTFLAASNLTVSLRAQRRITIIGRETGRQLLRRARYCAQQ